jgi:hypothetical protein
MKWFMLIVRSPTVTAHKMGKKNSVSVRCDGHTSDSQEQNLTARIGHSG